MTDQNIDPLIAFEQSRVADLAALYHAMAALTEAVCLDDLFVQSDAVQARIRELSPTMISTAEQMAFNEQVLALKDSRRKALGH